MAESKTISAQSSRTTASIFSYGNLASITLPVLIPFWFGASMFVYAMNRHHPNPRVGHYTQWAAYRFYALIGALVPVATFFPADYRYYVVTWIVLFLLLVPAELLALRKVWKEPWQDTEYTDDNEVHI
ncbi:MAG: hypothetical protein ACWA44_01155 [Thiotrichales bacterium]